MPAIPRDDASAPAQTDVQERMRQWRVAHPSATFAEIEAAADRHLASLRAELISAAAHADGEAARPDCPRCGRRMQQVGQRQRTVLTAQQEAVTLRGPGYRCPACGAGLFPPG